MKRVDLGNDKMFKLVFALAIPALLAQLVNVLYGVVDKIFIGSIPVIGDLALAGVGVSAPITTLLASFGTLVGLGGSIIMANSLGAKNEKLAKEALINSFYIIFVVAFILIFGFFMIKDQMLLLFGASENSFVYANDYIRVYVFGTFFQLLAIGLNYFLVCQGYAKKAMISVIIGALTNVLLDYVFIFVFDFAVIGAAFATIIGQFLAFIYTLRAITNKDMPVKITFSKPNIKVIKKILFLGAGPFIILSTDSLIILIFNALIKENSVNNVDFYISTATIVMSVFLLISAPLNGITSGTQAIVSFNNGKKDPVRLKNALVNISLVAFTYSALMTLIFLVFGKSIVSLFTSDEAIIIASFNAIKIFISMLLPMTLQYIFVDYLTAIEKVKISLFLSIFRKSIYVLSAFILAKYLDVSKIFFAEPISDLVSGSIATIIFIIIFKKFLKKMTE